MPFQLVVEFHARKENGNVDWDSTPILWEESFEDLKSATRAFMEMIPNCSKAHDKFGICNLKGKLVKDGESRSWDWTKIERRWEWERSNECKDWIDRIIKGIKIVINPNTSLIDALVQSKCCSSKMDAQRQIKQNAVKLNEVLIKDINRRITADELSAELILSKGKRFKCQLIKG